MADIERDILLIDDDESDALITTAWLEQASELAGTSYRVHWVDSFEAGLSAALGQAWDLALVDYQLCPGKGVDLIAQARQRGCTVPFILLTGLDDRDVDRQALEAGAFDFLCKGSSDALQLDRALRYSLRQAHTLDQLQRKSEELERANLELQRSNMELELFARAVSHDLRQPLHTIAGYTELLSMRYEQHLDDQARGMMGKIVAGVERMNHMIEDLLGLARLDSAGDSLDPVDLDAVLASVLEELEPTIERTGARIEHCGLPTLPGRSGHLRQLLRNLLGNALKFVGEQAPHIVIRCEPHGEHWLIELRDNGLGVPESMRETIFEPFCRGQHLEHFPGTGIGLALCRKIVQQHGGSIWVQPAEPSGSSFRFTLRRVEAQFLSPAAPPPAHAPGQR
jgi:signal transduction histidine kinase